MQPTLVACRAGAACAPASHLHAKVFGRLPELAYRRT